MTEGHNRELTPAPFWEDYWSSANHPAREPKGFIYFDEVAPYLPAGPDISFLEIGCAPGRILAEFCSRLDYEAHGLDFAAPAEEIEEYLRAEGVRVGNVQKADFLTWDPQRQYDVVASFGFVEHFTDAEAVVDRHFRLAKPGGTVVITLPNFARGQKVLNQVFNSEILRYHNTRCMSRGFMAAAARRNGAELLLYKYVGGHFQFKIRPQKRSWVMDRIVWRTRPLWCWLGERLARGSNSWFSPYIVAVFRAG